MSCYIWFYIPTKINNSILLAHQAQFPSHVIIATDASRKDEKVGVGILSLALDWSFSLRLLDYIPIFYAEFLALLLAVRKLDFAHSLVMVPTDSLSACTALSSGNTSVLKTFYSCAPSHGSETRLIWVPGHCRISLNEVADTLAGMALAFPVIEIPPPFACLTRPDSSIRGCPRCLGSRFKHVP